MPKHEINHPAGELAPKELRDLLLRFFDDEAIVKLERLGGRVLISLTSPYFQRKKGKRTKVDIGTQFIAELRDLRNDSKALKDKIALLTIKQLKEIGKIFDHPLRSKSARQEMIEELVAHIHGEDVWKRISNID